MRCNVCGKDYKDESRNEEFYNPLLHKFTITFGYGSNRDTEVWEYCKCEDCIIEEIENFNILPQIKNYEII